MLERLAGWPTWNWRSPFEELERMRREMDRYFEELTERTLRAPIAGVFPLTNITEDNDNFYVRAELPGVKPDELEISVTGDSLTITGERKISPENENVRYHRREREAGQFSRVITLPGQIDADNVQASASNGILTVILPKAEAAKPKQIAVKAS